jgi:hypothetical protein
LDSIFRVSGNFWGYYVFVFCTPGDFPAVSQIIFAATPSLHRACQLSRESLTPEPEAEEKQAYLSGSKSVLFAKPAIPIRGIFWASAHDWRNLTSIDGIFQGISLPDLPVNHVGRRAAKNIFSHQTTSSRRWTDANRD